MRILDSALSMPTMSGPVNPINSGFGAIFPSGSKIYMSNSLGELYDLTDSKGYMNVVVITGSSNQAWSKPGGLAYAHIICIGGGSGGGGGRQGAASTGRGGGGAGGGGATGQAWFNAADLPNGFYTASIAQAGGGGNGGTLINSNGLQGGSGNQTLFTKSGNVLVGALGTLSGGGRAFEGTTVGGAGNIANATFGSTPAGYSGPMYVATSSAASPLASFLQFTLAKNGTNGAPTSTGGGAGDNTSFPSNGGGGGGGGGISGSNVTFSGGSGSFATIVAGVLRGTGAPGGAGTGINGSNGTSNTFDAMWIAGFTSSMSCSFGLGNGGHGGGSGDLAGTIAGGRGGDGGNYGGGGGGGGGSTNGAAGGRGGNGGQGAIIIIEYY